MSMFPNGNPGNNAFRDYSPGPHAGVDTDPNAHVAHGSLDGRARNALVLGVLSLFLGVFAGIPAIWVGRKALIHLNSTDGDLRGREAAWAGILLGCLGIVIMIVAWVYLHEHPSSHHVGLTHG